MNIRDVYTAQAIAAIHTEVASNKIAYLGAGLFPTKKKMGLDLKWVKTIGGLPISLAPSNFDAVSTIRSREGFKVTETQMPFFRESKIIKEEDEQEIMRLQDTSDPYASEVLDRVFNDAEDLVDGADVVPERMRMQLLTPADGSPKISIKADNTTYAYNYDPNGDYKKNNFAEIQSTTDKWEDIENSNPLDDISEAKDTVEGNSGDTIAIAIVSRKTMNLIKKNKNVRSAILAQNATPNVLVTDAKVKELFKDEFGIDLIVYTKKYRTEDGKTEQFFADGFCTLLPSGTLGNTWKGTTPEERTLMGNSDADVSIVDNGIAIAVSVTNDPVHTKTTVSEIVLPSYERMDSTYVIKCY